MELRTRVSGAEHWTRKDEVKLFLWQKSPPSGESPKGTLLFVHGSSMASQPTFDLQVPGRPDSSAMEWFAARGYDTWCMDHEGYGRSGKSRPINCDIASGADDLAAGTKYDRAFVRSIFTRDHPGTADDATIEAFASAILELDDSVPTGTYVDMCAKLPVVDPAKITAPTLVMRGEFDGIAGLEDLIDFWRLLPNPDKQFAVMAGISHASFQQKNYLTAYHILHSFLTTPDPVYRA